VAEGKTGKQALSPSSYNSFDRDIRNWLLHIIKITLHNLLETEKKEKYNTFKQANHVRGSIIAVGTTLVLRSRTTWVSNMEEEIELFKWFLAKAKKEAIEK
jgi:hypothetical protein